MGGKGGWRAGTPYTGANGATNRGEGGEGGDGGIAERLQSRYDPPP